MKNIFLLLLITLTIISCEDFFETTLELEQPEVPDAFTFNVYVHDGLDELGIGHVSQVFGIDENVNFQERIIRDATLTIEDLTDGQTLVFESLGEMNSSIQYTLEKPVGFPIANRTYELKIEHPDYETVTANQVMPDKVKVDGINFLADAGVDEDGDEAAGVEITFTDTPGLNYYQITLHRQNVGGGISGGTLFCTSTDPSTYQTDNDIILIDDALFENEQKTLLIKFDRDLASESLAIDFRKLNEAQYKHQRTVDRAKETDGNPFQTPVQVFSNSSNGFGIFAMYSKLTVPIN